MGWKGLQEADCVKLAKKLLTNSLGRDEVAEEGAEEDEDKREGDPDQVLQRKAGLRLGIGPLVGCRDTRWGQLDGGGGACNDGTVTTYTKRTEPTSRPAAPTGCGILLTSPWGSPVTSQRGGGVPVVVPCSRGSW